MKIIIQYAKILYPLVYYDSLLSLLKYSWNTIYNFRFFKKMLVTFEMENLNIEVGEIYFYKVVFILTRTIF